MKAFRIILAFLCCSMYSAAFAQTAKKKPIFHSQELLGLINGKGAVSAGIQSINGVEAGNWFAGVGVGIDFYRYRSLPLFADVKRYFRIANGNKLFIYGDCGYNIPWSKEDNEQFSGWGGTTKVERDNKGGAYMDAGGGYAIQFSKGNALLLSLGFSHKYFSQKVVTTYQIGGEAGNAETTDIKQFNYNFNRLIIKIGWQF